MSPVRFCSFSAALLLALSVAASARAGIVAWDIDPTQSFFRLTIPDQSVTVGTTNATLRLRDASSTSAWTDAGGRMARIDGTISSNLIDGSTVDFSGGQANIFALEQRAIRPDPSAFNPLNTNGDNPDGQYSGTATALAALGAKVRATALLTFDVAFLAMDDVFFNLSTSGPIALGGGTAIAGSSTMFTLSAANLNVDGLVVALLGSQPIPDTLNAPLSLPLQTNTSTGSIISLGGLNRQLTLNIAIPFVLDIDGTIINGSAAGALVATAMVPEPSTMVLGFVGALGLVGVVHKRRRRRT